MSSILAYGRWPTLVLWITLSIILGGCDQAPPAQNQFAVALLLAGPENDAGWNQAAYEGLQKIRTDLNAKTRKITARTPTEIEQALRRAFAEEFDLVFGHGVEFNAPAARMAAEAGGTRLVTTGGAEFADNLATIQLRLEEAAYQLGILAGHLTETGIVSALSGEEFEPVRRVARGFRQGLLSVRPDAILLEEYVGSWEDSALAKEKALAHAAEGADVFFQNADAAGVGVFEAARSQGAFAFGCNRDQTKKAPDVILASAVAAIPETFLSIANEARGDAFVGGVRSFGMREGKVSVVFNEALRHEIPESAFADLDSARDRILDGTLIPGDS